MQGDYFIDFQNFNSRLLNEKCFDSNSTLRGLDAILWNTSHLSREGENLMIYSTSTREHHYLLEKEARELAIGREEPNHCRFLHVMAEAASLGC